MKAYKLIRVRQDGTLGSLFINRSDELPVGRWMQAEDHPTDGYAHRPGWHATAQPRAPHLSKKGRRWYLVEIRDYERLKRPKGQGGPWYLAQQMKILRPVHGRGRSQELLGFLDQLV